MGDPVRWQLLYRDGTRRAEPLEGATIRETLPDPLELQLIDARDVPVARVMIPRGRRPIFYRRRSMAPGEAAPTLEATVFGYGVDLDDRIDSTLWVWSPAGIRDATLADVDDAQVQMQVLRTAA